MPASQGKAEGAGGSAMASGSGLSSGEVELALAMEGQAVAVRGSGGKRRAWRLKESSPLIQVLVINDNDMWINDSI